MTRDGFTILAMGFTGKEAMAWKEKFIQAFNMLYGEVIGWLTLGVGIMVLAAVDGILDRIDDCRMQRLADRED
jgi:hypothetical protein